ncbi:MAG: fatty acid desaturase [Gammaproteobacteria bacterium]
MIDLRRELQPMRIRLNYLCSFILPLSVLLFLVSGPHGTASALAWTLPVWGLVLVDRFGPKIDTTQPAEMPHAFYDWLLYALALLQLLNIALMLHYVERLSFATPGSILTGAVNLIAVRILVGTSSGSSGIIAAHELIHRSGCGSRLLGRLVLWSVCYDHFILAHTRGHHFHVGMQQDIATARYGENFSSYWKRVSREHFIYAWRSEAARLRSAAAPLSGLQIIGNRVLHGLLCEALLLAAVVTLYGWLAAAVFAYQAFAAVRLLEAINYFQHWGLEDGKSSNTLAWVNDSFLSKYALIGLSYHIGHHRNAAKAFYQLPYSAQGPKMPYGYFVMNLWIKLDNASYRSMAMHELENYRRNAAMLQCY